MNQIIERYLVAKAKEQAAKNERLAAEHDLFNLVSNDKVEGSKSLTTDRFKVSVTNKVTRILDHEAYQSVLTDIPHNMRFVDYKPAINLKNLRHLEVARPDIVASCVTVKPAKPSITVKEVS